MRDEPLSRLQAELLELIQPYFAGNEGIVLMYKIYNHIADVMRSTDLLNYEFYTKRKDE